MILVIFVIATEFLVLALQKFFYAIFFALGWFESKFSNQQILQLCNSVLDLPVNLHHMAAVVNEVVHAGIHKVVLG